MDLNNRVLIISPYFPPSNTADMQRVRMSLPYFAAFGWDATIITVDPAYSDAVKDELLSHSLPSTVRIHYVKALSKKITARIGLGSIALRSLSYYKKQVNRLLRQEKYELIYFSTTQFPVCILGAYWKRRFHIPYVIDMQDPWHSDFYQDKPANERPKKYWFSYRLNKYLEPIAIKSVSGLISVSGHYIADLKKRYPTIQNIPAATITFGAFEPDLKIAEEHAHRFPSLLLPGFKNIVYIGRGGADMHTAIAKVFSALKKGLETTPEKFSRLKFYFIGTSYAPAGEGTPSIMPLAEKYSVADNVIELTDRISYYHTLCTLQQADALFIPGSNDPKYTASKIYPYLLTRKPLLAIFNESSGAVGDIRNCTDGAFVYTFNNNQPKAEKKVYDVLSRWADRQFIPLTLSEKFKDYSAENLTLKQVELFNSALKYFEATDTNA